MTSALSAGQVREKVLEQHGSLRILLRTALENSEAALRGEPKAIERLVPLMMELRQRMLAHLAFEEAMLVPALRRADSWGGERAEMLLSEHARQRAELDTLLEGESGAWGDVAVALILETLVSEILADMQEEERDILTPAILRDDIVVVEQFGG